MQKTKKQMSEDYSHKKERKSVPKTAKEQEAAYYSSMSYTKEAPDYVKEDIRIGLEQYKRGECHSVSSFMNKYE